MQYVLFLFSLTLATAGEYTIYIGDAFPRTVTAVATDTAGNTYVGGNRGNPGVPTASSTPVVSPSSPNDVFVSNIDPSGNIIFTRSFAGKGADQGLAVAVDPTGNIYVAGSTTSPDFPISNALQPQVGSAGAGFIVKLSADGRTIPYSTYFGGLQGLTSINAMTTDAAGNLYLTGATSAADFPVTIGTLPAPVIGKFGPGQVAFVAAISAAGDKILFSRPIGDFAYVAFYTIFGCPGITTGIGIALDAARNIYFDGNTYSGVATTPGAFVSQGLGAFAGKIAPDGSLVYLTYLDGAIEPVSAPATGASLLTSFTVDTAGNAYLAGTTANPKFPVTPGAYQITFAGGSDGFLAKLKPDGTGLAWATYFGSSPLIQRRSAVSR